MNFIRWIQSARQFTGNTALSVTDIFPAANLDDDFNPVADFKNEQAVTNTASITAETTARTNADSALDTRVTTLEGASGGGFTDSVFFSAEDGGSTVQLSDDARHFLWSRNGGGSSGTTVCATMPVNPTEGQSILIHCFGSETNDGGTLQLKIPSSHSATWRSYSQELPEISKQDSTWKQLNITKYRRKTYLAFYHVSSGTAYWYLKTVTSQRHETIIANEAALTAAQPIIAKTLTTDLSSSATSTELATADVIKSYVDSNSLSANTVIQATGATGQASLKILSHADAADDMVMFTLERDSSNPSTGGHDHKVDFSLTQHGSARFVHTLFQNVPTSTLTYETMRWSKFGCIMIPGGATSSVVDSHQSGSVSEPGLNILQGTFKHTGLGSNGCKMILNNLPTSAAGLANNQVYRDANGFLRIT